MKTVQDILDLIKAEGVEFIRLQFTDMFGNLKNVAVTAAQLRKILADKYRIEDQVMFGSEGGYDGELILEPDYDTFMILPWRPQQGKVAKLMCDVCRPDGTLFEMSSRTILKKVIKAAGSKGYSFMIRPECEFFLFHLDENGLPTTVTHDQAGLMDVGPVDSGENARREMVLLLEQMGFMIESSHHEDAPAQHEIDFKEADTLHAADSIMTFRFAVRSIAKRFGLYATFMPKPKSGEAGSGMHLNFTVYRDGVNIMDDMKDTPNSETVAFINGILKHSSSLSAYTNPTVNSYKRIMQILDDSRENRAGTVNSTYLRVRDSLFEPAIEFRFPDSSANPYLALALIISAGLKGIEEGLDKKTEKKICFSSVSELPGDLKSALFCAKVDTFIKDVLGDEFTRIYIEAKMREWNEFMKEVSDWEIRNYLYKY